MGTGKLKEECTVVVVSHDLYELQDQVHSPHLKPQWRMTLPDEP